MWRLGRRCLAITFGTAVVGGPGATHPAQKPLHSPRDACHASVVRLTFDNPHRDPLAVDVRASWSVRWMVAHHRRGGPHGYDGAKRLNGRKRHLLVDTLGLVCKAYVTAADVSDRDGAMAVLGRLDWRRLPRVRHGWVDQGYRGEFLAQVKQRFGVTLEVVVRRDGARRARWLPPGAQPPAVPAFAMVPRRWVVEGTFGWLGRFRRLS